jgi:hypothetical protein
MRLGSVKEPLLGCTWHVKFAVGATKKPPNKTLFGGFFDAKT